MEQLEPFLRFELAIYPNAEGTGEPLTTTVQGPMSRVIDAAEAGLANARRAVDELRAHEHRAEDQ